jgi:GNAT superfamily N-acetyltransferase
LAWRGQYHAAAQAIEQRSTSSHSHSKVDNPAAMLQVRPFSPADTPGIVSLILPIQQLEFGIPVTLEAQPDLMDIATVYQRGGGNFWVAEAQAGIVGTIGLLDIGNHQAALRKMFVAQPFRGREHGAAQKLLDTLVGWAASRRIVEIFLGTTDKFVAAHRFYEKNRFMEIRKSELPADFPVMAVDSKFYQRCLRQDEA